VAAPATMMIAAVARIIFALAG